MAIARYQKPISGPLLDCIDIHVEAPRVDNVEMVSVEVRVFCHVEPSTEKLLKAAMQQLHNQLQIAR